MGLGGYSVISSDDVALLWIGKPREFLEGNEAFPVKLLGQN